MFTVVTFGDSILDCARYNDHGVHPGQLIVRNDDRLFPAFADRDLSSSAPARLDHRAQDGGRVEGLERTDAGDGSLRSDGRPGHDWGNDLLGGLAQTIEPSLRGASEIRAAFLPAVLDARG